MKTHSSYKDSKIDWVGEIPSHWNLNKIKYIFFQRKEKNDPIQTDNILSLTIQQGVIPLSEKKSGGNKPKDDLSKYNLTHEGDIVMNSMNVIVGSVGISNYFGVVSPVYYVLRQINSEENIRYYHHLFRTNIFQKSLTGLGNGILIKKTESSGKLNTIRMRIPMDKLNQVLIPHPPVNEQTQIVSFLDTKTQKIDELIEKTEQKIKLLKEKRTSLINHCLTKGLNPNVEMKDSGVEWIGGTPINWNKISLGRIGVLYGGLTGKNGEDFRSDDNPLNKPYIPFTNISNNTYISKDHFQYVVVGENENQNRVEKYDLFFLMSSEGYDDLGKTSILIEDIDELYLNSFCKGFRITKDNVYPLFLNYQLSGYTHKKLISVEGNGFTRINLRQSRLKETPIFLPPLPVQQQIVEYLDEQTQKIDSTIEKETQRIELLKEYRQSLISEVVTGKIDVRGLN